MKKIFLVLLTLLAAPLAKADFENLSVLALSPQDNRAVVRLNGGDVKMLTPGDEISGASIMQVLPDKLVLKDGNGELLWLLKSTGTESSKVRRFHSTLPQEEVRHLGGPMVISQDDG